MKIKTKYFGTIDIFDEQIIRFDAGLFGFESQKEFVLLDITENNYFKVLQDTREPYIAFIVTNPWEFFHDYDIHLSDDKLKKIGIEPETDNNIAVYNIVTLGDSLKTSTCNLLAPVVINLDNKRGKQLIADDNLYTTKHMLFPEEIGD